MATSFHHEADIHGTIPAAFQAFSDEQFWRDRLRTVGTPNDTVDSFSADATRVAVTVTHVIPEDRIPAAARKVVGTTLQVVRSTTYHLVSPERIDGTAEAEGAGGLARVKGSGYAEPTSPGVCTERYEGTVKVSVPLVGGKLERMVVEYLEQMFPAEADYLNTYLAAL